MYVIFFFVINPKTLLFKLKVKMVIIVDIHFTIIIIINLGQVS